MWHPRIKGGLQQGVFTQWVLLVEERRWAVCPRWELNWFLDLSFPFIYPMGDRGDSGRTLGILGGAWVSPLTGGFKSLGPSWKVLEDENTWSTLPSFRTFLGQFKMAARERELVRAAWGLTYAITSKCYLHSKVHPISSCIFFFLKSLCT